MHALFGVFAHCASPGSLLELTPYSFARHTFRTRQALTVHGFLLMGFSCFAASLACSLRNSLTLTLINSFLWFGALWDIYCLFCMHSFQPLDLFAPHSPAFWTPTRSFGLGLCFLPRACHCFHRGFLPLRSFAGLAWTLDTALDLFPNIPFWFMRTARLSAAFVRIVFSYALA